jgi:hypothetical protein
VLPEAVNLCFRYELLDRKLSLHRQQVQALAFIHTEKKGIYELGYFDLLKGNYGFRKLHAPPQLVQQLEQWCAQHHILYLTNKREYQQFLDQYHIFHDIP